MRSFLLNYFGKETVGLVLGVLIASFVRVCVGEQMPSSLLPLAPVNQGLQWVLGPTTANIGEYATVEVPDGYRFADARGARLLLQRMGNPVPRSLVGILSPNAGKWWVVLEYKNLGYVKDVDRNSRIDSQVVLKAVQERIARQNADRAMAGAQPISSIDWKSPPVFDADRFALEWSVRAQAGSQGVINQTVRLLGRHGVLDATAVQADLPSSESIPLKELMQNVYFNAGERYTDFQRGDKLAKVGLEELVIGEEDEGGLSTLVKASIWSGAAFLACVVATAGVIVVRRKLRQRDFAEAIAVIRGRTPSYRPPGPPAKNGRGSGALKSKTTVRNGSRARSSPRRRSGTDRACHPTPGAGRRLITTGFTRT
jgi:uncharacterized membrane-anchored protein